MKLKGPVRCPKCHGASVHGDVSCDFCGNDGNVHPDDAKLYLETAQAYIAIDHCPTHGFRAVSVRRGMHGRRLTDSKCCGSWHTQVEWRLDPQDLREVADWLESPKFPEGG